MLKTIKHVQESANLASGRGLWAFTSQLVTALREFVAPQYRPELHYMRGLGPAYARRAIMVETRRILPKLRRERG